MSKIMKGIAAFAVSGVVLVMPVAAHAGTAVNWTARTCAAEKAWVKHPATARLNTMMTDSENAPWKYIGEDADGLYRDVRGGKTQYIAKDEKYFSEDCG